MIYSKQLSIRKGKKKNYPRVEQNIHEGLNEAYKITENSVALNINIDSLSHDGRGVARVNGKTVFVEGALPNEIISGRYYKRHKNFDEIICDEILEPSSQRVVPLCPHFSLCGGCSLQHLNPESQRLHKQNVILEQLRHFGQITVAPEKLLLPVFYESSWEYRYRARLSVSYSEKQQKSYLGFRERIDPKRITDIQTCDILYPPIGKHINELSALVNSLKAKQHITQIEIAVGDENCALIFRHMVSLSKQDREKLTDFAKQFGFWILLQANDIYKLEWLLPEKPDSLFYRLVKEDLTFFFHPAHFTQVNPIMNQKLVQQALDLLKPESNETILDLFCGLGNFSLPIAKRVKSIVGVEGSEMMVKQAEQNAVYNKIKNAYFYTSDLSNLSFQNAPWAKGKYDKILLDPARTGALEIIQSIELWNPKSIVYVSCNPATLARDAGILVHQKGYRLSQIGIADMFPHTTHVESIALFTK